MADELVLYTNPMSRGRIARFMLEEVGEPYRAEIVEYGPPMKGAEYRAVNPMGKVPALLHGQRRVTEAAAICAYLADAFPEAGLAPPPSERADYYRWLFFFAGPVEAATVNQSMGWTTDDPMMRGRTGYGSLETVMRTLTDHLGTSEWIAGDGFTAADVYCGMAVSWGLQFGTMPEHEALGAYAARVTSRPAFERARDKDDALMPKEAG